MTEPRRVRRTAQALAALVLLLAVAGCRQDMHDQPLYTPLEPSDFFDDGISSRTPVEGTVARGQLRDDVHLYTGRVGKDFAPTFPFAVSAEDLERGQQRYDVYCSPCHDRQGGGNGMIIQRGFRRRPPSFHDQRLREVPPGYVFDVITNGFGAMQDYSAQVETHDRWRIVAYVRALQLSQNARPEDVPAAERGFLSAAGTD